MSPFTLFFWLLVAVGIAVGGYYLGRPPTQPGPEETENLPAQRPQKKESEGPTAKNFINATLLRTYPVIEHSAIDIKIENASTLFLARVILKAEVFDHHGNSMGGGNAVFLKLSPNEQGVQTLTLHGIPAKDVAGWKPELVSVVDAEGKSLIGEFALRDRP